MEINSLNLPYRKLPRPYRSNPISKLFRFIFEKRSIQRLFGVQLVSAMMAIPVVGQLTATRPPEPPLNVVMPELSQSEMSDIVSTKDREYVVPVERFRFLGQGFHSGHLAYDVNSYVGDDVYAFTSGQVAKVEDGQFGLGRYIILDHGHGLVSVYGHLQDFAVSQGEMVETGQTIGRVGMTGYTTGPHVHFEVHDNGVAVNPGLYLAL